MRKMPPSVKWKIAMIMRQPSLKISVWDKYKNIRNNGFVMHQLAVRSGWVN